MSYEKLQFKFNQRMSETIIKESLSSKHQNFWVSVCYTSLLCREHIFYFCCEDSTKLFAEDTIDYKVSCVVQQIQIEQDTITQSNKSCIVINFIVHRIHINCHVNGKGQCGYSKQEAYSKQKVCKISSPFICTLTWRLICELCAQAMQFGDYQRICNCLYYKRHGGYQS